MMGSCYRGIALIFLAGTCLRGEVDWDLCVVHGDYDSLRRQQDEETWMAWAKEAAAAVEGYYPLERENFQVIAIDGGAGSGKTTTARALAERCGFAFVSTGEHYRLLTHFFLKENISARLSDAVEKRLRSLRPTTIFQGNRAHLSLDGRLVSDRELRRPEINDAVPDYAAIPAVRKFLHAYERELPLAALSAGFRGIVAEGRDVTGTVFPDAILRVCLMADLDERARRRAREGVRDDVADRDRRDSEQMQLPEGIWCIDSTHLSLEEVVELLRQRLEDLRP
ncbi:MAG: (d)CMP kinase [Puniceicoccales bacterium]|jgi:cytidylate kinase|nr:(d)CMP kinase [Puniceicoccales bacterium]